MLCSQTVGHSFCLMGKFGGRGGGGGGGGGDGSEGAGFVF